jgi:hypothetical protein
MTIFTNKAARWRDRLGAFWLAHLRRSDGVHARLRRQVNTVLMVHDDRLHDLGNGAWRSLGEWSSAEQIAAAARELLPSGPVARSVLLLLPASRFIATTANLPGVARENLHAALQLQASVLLPAYEGRLALAINPAARDVDRPDIALWADDTWLAALFDAFARQGLLLAAVLPRPLAALDSPLTQDTLVVEDVDRDSVTQLVFRKGMLHSWLQMQRADLDDPELRTQWQEACALAQGSGAGLLRLQSASDWTQRGMPQHWDSLYCFIPEGAQAVYRLQRKARGLRQAAMAAAVAALLLISPFLWQSLQIARLEATLAEQQTFSVEARADQAVVRDFDQRWGALNDFPRQDVAQVLLQLQSVLSPSVLTSLELVEGELQIEGESEDPQSLLQRLEQDAMFTGVDFARATSNNRYYIEMRLSTVDFAEYHERYFPDARR